MFRLRLLRALVIEGKRWLAGAELLADARCAASMIREGTARLACAGDLARLAHALPESDSWPRAGMTR
jgi:hypothetical protein